MVESGRMKERSGAFPVSPHPPDISGCKPPPIFPLCVFNFPPLLFCLPGLNGFDSRLIPFGTGISHVFLFEFLPPIHFCPRMIMCIKGNACF